MIYGIKVLLQPAASGEVPYGAFCALTGRYD